MTCAYGKAPFDGQMLLEEVSLSHFSWDAANHHRKMVFLFGMINRGVQYFLLKQAPFLVDICKLVLYSEFEML
jgi:hypothetical protein